MLLDQNKVKADYIALDLLNKTDKKEFSSLSDVQNEHCISVQNRLLNMFTSQDFRERLANIFEAFNFAETELTGKSLSDFIEGCARKEFGYMKITSYGHDLGVNGEPHNVKSYIMGSTRSGNLISVNKLLAYLKENISEYYVVIVYVNTDTCNVETVYCFCLSKIWNYVRFVSSIGKGEYQLKDNKLLKDLKANSLCSTKYSKLQLIEEVEKNCQ